MQVQKAEPNPVAIQAIEHIRTIYGDFVFKSGSCHDLAAALHDAFGGSLHACIRSQIDESGQEFSRCYSHMVWCDLSETCFDIDGLGADDRWMALWPDEPDEDGLNSDFEWIAVNREDLPAWVASWGAKHDAQLIEDLSSLILVRFGQLALDQSRDDARQPQRAIQRA
jgi:hypothetical protein